MYPQSKVVDDSLIATLNNNSGGESITSWSPYDYHLHLSSNHSAFMWYIDLEENGQLYRGVYLEKYRPYRTNSSPEAIVSYQDNNGYYLHTKYWFKYEPIVWNVLAAHEDAGPLLLSAKILDSQDYYHSTSNRTINGETIHPNNYKKSYLRGFLNNAFYSTAFSSQEAALIATTTVDNSEYAGYWTPNPYACENTNDKIFALSYRDVRITSAYGLSTYAGATRQATDYAKAMGVYVNPSNLCSHWWHRSPSSSSYYRACYTRNDAYFLESDVYWICYGVLPALRLNR